jgi:hypothetical protein
MEFKLAVVDVVLCHNGPITIACRFLLSGLRKTLRPMRTSSSGGLYMLPGQPRKDSISARAYSDYDISSCGHPAARAEIGPDS